MLSKWPIRNKLLVGIGLLLGIVATLAWSGFHGVYAYRSLVKGLSGRATELPLASEMSREVSNLRSAVSEARGLREAAAAGSGAPARDPAALHQQFAASFAALGETLKTYREQLQDNYGGAGQSTRINDSRDEWQTLRKIDKTLADIDAISSRGDDWLTVEANVDAANSELERLQSLVGDLPSYLHQRIHDLAGEVRTQYRVLIVLTWVTTISAALLLIVFFQLFYSWVFRPLRVLITGSRRVAAGDFGHRITLDNSDEIAELAAAMNDMTARFQAIRDDLDRQVQERTRQVVRSEQLASVGFLAAGVAHEINNPLASIALCAESLEGRIQEVLDRAADAPSVNPTSNDSPSSDSPGNDHEVIRNYLRMIQNEAFRCKGITERLLDFSRTGDVKRHDTDLGELVQGVIDMVGHLGRYHGKRIEFAHGRPVVAAVNAQEIKQVVLNLITNGLDSLTNDGAVRIALSQREGRAELEIADDGCGMTDEVRQHLFEPFFTRRRTGQGVGLGLSITFRIVADHGGHIDVHSDGPGKGSRFRVSLPLTVTQGETSSPSRIAA